MSSDALGESLLALARNAIAIRFGHSAPPVTPLPEHRQPGATFVTLTLHDRLRGCIGSLEAHRPLALDVTENAVAAAFRDPRFAPLTVAEFESTGVEVSLLEVPRPLEYADEADALARLRPGIDGVILRCGNRRATFLPQVWAQLPDPAQFMAHLKQKAGLPADFWDAGISLACYGVRKWKETDR